MTDSEMIDLETRLPALRRQLTVIQNKRRATRKGIHRHSRIDRYRMEIMGLVSLGASARDIALWLYQYRQVKVTPVTVWRRVTYWCGREKKNS